MRNKMPNTETKYSDLGPKQSKDNSKQNFQSGLEIEKLSISKNNPKRISDHILTTSLQK